MNLSAATGTAAQTGEVKLKEVTEDNLVENINIDSAIGAQKAVLIIDQAIQQIDAQRAELGAVQTASRTPLVTCKTFLRTFPQHVVESETLTLPQKLPT